MDIELGSHHGSQQGSAAVSSHEGEEVGEVDEDEAAAAADFTPMTEEKRIFVNEWIAKLGTEAPEEDDEQVPTHKKQSKHLMPNVALTWCQFAYLIFFCGSTELQSHKNMLV